MYVFHVPLRVVNAYVLLAMYNSEHLVFLAYAPAEWLARPWRYCGKNANVMGSSRHTRAGSYQKGLSHWTLAKTLD